MKYAVVFFDTVGNCPYWVCDTKECGIVNLPCELEPMDEPPKDCPCESVPTKEKT